MEGSELLFELRSPSGDLWRLYLDGRVEGFPEGTAVMNRALPLVYRMVGEMKKQAIPLTAEKPQAVPI